MTAVATVCPVQPGSKVNDTMVCPVDQGANVNKVDDEPQGQHVQHEQIDYSKLAKIPHPPHQYYFGVFGHLPELDPGFPPRTYWRLMDEIGPIFELDMGMSMPRIFVGNHGMMNELSDDSRFKKFIHNTLKEARAFLGDGLFTAELEEKNWWKAHRLLAPAFGPLGLRKMFDDMVEISSQLVLKWDRFGADHEIDLIEDATRLAFDTIGLCAFGYRFNEFYTKEQHSFATQLQQVLLESGKRGNRPPIVNQLYYRSEQRRQENMAKMRELAIKILQDRVESPNPDATDLLNLMLDGVDRETGEKLDIENVRFQIPTFLGAGYETTSASLTFLYYFLCSNPNVLAKAQREVDEVVGDKVITPEMLPNLHYLEACMRESLRVQPPNNLINKVALRDTVIGGKYLVRKGQIVSGVQRHFHRDKSVWGEDSDVYRPERMLKDGRVVLPTNAWKPFGEGLRGCIGRGFSEQEMLINAALVLQRFSIGMADPNYNLELRCTLTIKPLGFKMKVRRRPGRSLLVGIPGGGELQKQQGKTAKSWEEIVNTARDKKRITVFFGGETGTSETLAESLSRAAPEFGLEVVDVQDLDAATENLPTNKPFIIVTASYEGRPPANSRKFVAWIEKLSSKGEKLPSGHKFAVFGVGNSDWEATFHRIPRLVDSTLVQLGAEQIIEPGFANVKSDLIGPWDAWSEDLCLALSEVKKTVDPKTSVGVDVQLETNAVTTLPQMLGGESMIAGTVLASRELATADTSLGSAKRHVDVRLPPGDGYRAGDYLVVLGQNPEETVSRVMRRFGISNEAVMKVGSSKKDFLPLQPIAVEHFLRSRVELATPITKRQIMTFNLWANEGSVESARLQAIQDGTEYQDLLDKRYSTIDLLEEVPQLQLPFGVFVDLLLPLTPRQYSISSSPLDLKNKSDDKNVVSLTFDVLEGPALSGHGTFRGVTSSYLAARRPGDRIACIVRPTHVPFHLPVDTTVPIIMLATGSGIAPMRAFIQERAALQKYQGKDLGQALLLFGCRHPEHDFLYRQELLAWEAQGVVEVVPCFSKPTGGLRRQYVPDAMWERRDRLWDMFHRHGAVVFVCGSAAKLGKSAAEMWRRIWMEQMKGSEEEAHEWFEGWKMKRYISDLF